MSISLALSVAVLIAGLVILLVQRRFNEIWGSMFLGGLIAVLLAFGGHASLRIG